MNNDVIDEKALNKLLHVLGGDIEDLHELIDDFSDIGPEMIDSLNNAVQASDTKSLRVSAHSLKSNAREFGATELEQLCQTLEHQCNENTLQRPEEQVAQITESFVKAHSALQEIKKHRA